MKKIGKYSLFVLVLGGMLTVVGVFLWIGYYVLEQSCVVNRIPCPNFASYPSIGASLLVIGLALLISISIVEIGITRSGIFKGNGQTSNRTK